MLLKLVPDAASIRSVLATALLLTACTRPVFGADNPGADYKGTMDFECCDTAFHLKIHGQPNNASKKEIILRLHQGCPGRLPLEGFVSVDRLEVKAELCGPESKQCEPATAAKIYLDSVSKNGKHASGNFSVDFPSVGHQEGKFDVKYHHEGPRYICE
jgi:hypothetical protein